MLGAHFSDLHPYFAAPTAQAVLAENKPASQLTADYATVWLALLAGCAPSSQDIYIYIINIYICVAGQSWSLGGEA